MSIRVGIGYDSHPFEKGKPLFLGGIEIPYELGLKGHSDGDVLIHSIIDALLGASSLPNIGELFPNSDSKFKNIRSTALLREIFEILVKEEIKIINIDCVLILEEPKLSPYTKEMQKNLSKILEIEEKNLNVKAKTNEKMGFIGRKEGIACFSVCLIEKT